MHGGGAVLVTELFDTCVDGHCELSIENNRTVFAIDVDVVFAGAGVDAVDDVVEVLIDEEDRSAEDHEVEVELGDGVVEVGFGEDKVEQAFALGEPEGDRRCFGRVDPANLKAKPK